MPPSEYSLYQQIVINCQIHRFAAATGTSGRNSNIRCIPAPAIRRCNKRQIRLASFQLADISLRNAGSPGQRFLRQFRPQCTICVESEEALRGHLLITFISSVITKILMDRLLNTRWSPVSIYSILQYQIAQIFLDYLLTSEPVKNMNDIYKHFRITCPSSIPYKATADELARMGVDRIN